MKTRIPTRKQYRKQRARPPISLLLLSSAPSFPAPKKHRSSATQQHVSNCKLCPWIRTYVHKVLLGLMILLEECQIVDPDQHLSVSTDPSKPGALGSGADGAAYLDFLRPPVFSCREKQRKSEPLCNVTVSLLCLVSSEVHLSCIAGLDDDGLACDFTQSDLGTLDAFAELLDDLKVSLGRFLFVPNPLHLESFRRLFVLPVAESSASTTLAHVYSFGESSSRLTDFSLCRLMASVRCCLLVWACHQHNHQPV